MEQPLPSSNETPPPALPKQCSDGALLTSDSKLSECDFESRRASLPVEKSLLEELDLTDGSEELSSQFMPNKSHPIMINVRMPENVIVTVRAN